MPESTPDKDQHDTIESPYRISWRRLLKIIIPIFVLFFAIAYWFVGIYTPSKIEAPTTVPTPDFQEATPSAKTATGSAQKDKIEGWKRYSNDKIGFSLKYPTSWVANTECEETVVFFAPTQETLGICNSGTSGLIDVSFIDTDFKTYIAQLVKESYDNFKEEETKIDGKETVKRSGTFNGKNGTPKGAQRVEYLVNSKGKVVAINYTKLSDWSDRLSDFETIVSTFKFLN